MKSLSSFAAFLYFATSLFAIPAIIYFTWGLFFFPELQVQATMQLIGKLLAWVVCGGVAVKLLADHRVKKIRAVAGSVTPSDFVSRFEIFGAGADRYLSISPSTQQLVVVDLQRKVARCEPSSFVQSYNLDDGERQATLTIMFADFDFSTIAFHFGRMHRHDITARLELALKW